MLKTLVLFGFVIVQISVAQPHTATREAGAVIGPTQWSVTINDPPCALQVYIGRLNTTQDKASCHRICVNLTDLPVGTKVTTIKLFSREERGEWFEGAVPWGGWDQADSARGCAVFKNWSNNRYREAKVVVTYEVPK